MKLYVYDAETMVVVAVITGETSEACEKVVADQYGDTDCYATTYSPAFGSVDGLIDSIRAKEIAA